MAKLIMKKFIINPIQIKSAAACYKQTIQTGPYLVLPGNNQQKYGIANYGTVAIDTESAVKQAKPCTEIPGPKSYPFIGSAALVLQTDFDKTQIHVYWKKAFKKYGPIMQVKIPGRKPIVALFRPEDFETLYRATMNNPIRETFSSLKKVRDDAVENYFEKKGGLLPENHEEWWRVRSKVQTPMMKPQNVLKYLSKMDEVSLEFMDRISDLQNKDNEMPEYFLEELYKWALESVGLVALNRRLGCLNPNISKDSTQMNLINSVSDIFISLNTTERGIFWWRFFPTPSYKKLKKAHNTFLEMADANIRETEAAMKAREEIATDDELTLMESLLRTEGLSRKDVVTMILDMLMAGIDTTSHTIAFTLYLLAKNPEVQKKLQKEVDAALGEGKGHLTASHLAKLSYLKNCVKEALRMFPITIGTVRTLEQDIVLCGYAVPKGYQVVNINAIAGWDQQNFERADEFLPERWSRDRPLGAIHPYASLPFSAGTRTCIGRRIAEQEIHTFLARAVHRYNIEYNYADMGMETCIVFKPSQPLKFKFIERIRN